ncbi:MAG: energy transducer TonB [Candidatus Azobacteroides sp.]|nr:energy transducer TonB [Candidatus Azobacteroides sp.]
MAPPKTSQANLENKRTLYLLIGYVMAMSFLYICLEWRNGGILQNGFFDQDDYAFREDFIPVTWDIPEEELPLPIIEVSAAETEELVSDPTELNVIDNENTLPEENGTGQLEELPEPALPAEEILPPAGLDRMPEFPGGIAALRAYIYRNLIYPAEALRNRTEGVVLCTFIITEKGRVTDVQILEGKTPEMNEEAVRILSQMPPWKPGSQQGKTVSVRYVLSVSFRLR